MNNKKYSKSLIITIIFGIFIIALSAGTTYALFSARLTSEEKSMIVDTKGADLSLTFLDGETNDLSIADNILPGWSKTRTFSIKGVNTSDKILYYDLKLTVENNTFSETGTLKYQITGSGTGSQSVLGDIQKEKGVYSLFGSDQPYFDTTSESGSVHSYTLTMSFPNDPNHVQNEQYAIFNGYLTLESGKISGKNSKNGGILTLPEYQILEYIESTGTEYIDTNINSSTNISFETELAMTSTQNALNIVGSREGDGSESAFGIISFSGQQSIGFFMFGNSTNGIIPYDNNFHYYYLSKEKGIIDNITRTFPSNNTLKQNNRTITLFAYHESDTTNKQAERIKYFKLYNNGELVLDLIPCYRKLDGEVGMYDLVEGEFYENKGSGSFIKGPETEYGYQRVE